MRSILVATAAFAVLCASPALESTPPDPASPSQPTPAQAAQPCYQSIVALNTQASLIANAARQLASERTSAQRAGERDMSARKARFSAFQASVEQLSASTQRFQADWTRWRKECVTPASYNGLVKQRVLDTKRAISESLDMRAMTGFATGFEPISAMSCVSCYSPSLPHCDPIECAQCCTKCPPDPDPFASCAIQCKQNYLFCMLSAIVKMVSESVPHLE